MEHHDFPAWDTVVQAMPIPAALVDGAGRVLTANRWLDADPGDQLLRPAPGETIGTLRFSISGGRWRVVPLDEDRTIMLATGERQRSEDQLMRQFFSAGDSLLFVVYDQAGLIVEHNEAWDRLLGYPSDDVFGTDAWSLLPEEEQTERKRVEATLREDGKTEAVFKMRTKSGDYRQIRWVLRFDKSVGKCFGIGRDITDEAEVTAELERKAFHDQLTGLANRARLLERLEDAFAHGASPSLLFCDLDKFKAVNDSLGHQAGDVLLASLAHRLSSIDLGDDVTLARLGGDEFVVLLEHGGEERACRQADRLLTCLQEPFEVSGRLIHLTMSVGISSTETSTERTTSRLLGDADTAAYVAKDRGRNQWVVFDAGLHAAAALRFELEVELREALVDGHIEAHYQPIVEVASGRVIGAEALVRWRHGNRLMRPGEFLDVAEDAGLMARLGGLVIDETIIVAQRFASAGHPTLMSINVSDPELESPSFAEDLFEQVTSAGLEPDSFLIEITESAASAIDTMLPILQELRTMGFHLSLDDFGTGYSSLAHIRGLPIDVVKVHRSFVAGLVDDKLTGAVTSSLIDLWRALDLVVIVEGVETVEQAAVVERIGATIAQGYLLHRPMPRHELEELVFAQTIDPDDAGRHWASPRRP